MRILYNLLPLHYKSAVANGERFELKPQLKVCICTSGFKDDPQRLKIKPPSMMQEMCEEMCVFSPFIILFLLLCSTFLGVIATSELRKWNKKKDLSECKQTLFHSRTTAEQNHRQQCFDKYVMSVRTLLRWFTIR